MIHLSQHIPGFVDGVTPHIARVETQAELLATPWVAQYKDFFVGKPFYRFSLSRDPLSLPLLMAEFDEGRHWWVVGLVKEGADELTLPTWEPVRDE